MKKQHFKKTFNGISVFRPAGSIRCACVVTALLLSTLSSAPLKAQVTEQRTHVFDNYDVKNYSIDKLTASGMFVMSGTIYDPAGADDNSIHLLVTKNGTGGIGSTIVTRQYDDIGYDERAIGAHFVSNDQNNIVIVGSRRDLNPGGEANIEVLRVDGNGVLQRSYIVNDQFANADMHPMSTLVQDNYLFICGYTTAIGSGQPDYRTAKEIFVLKYNLDNDVVERSQRFNYTPPLVEYDYDMAVRMKMLSNGLLFVTGSCNAYNTSVPNWDPMSEGYYCATLSLTLNPDLTIKWDRPFSEFRSIYGGWPSSSITAAGEYGNDIVEDPNTGGCFVFGNTYVAYPYTSTPFLQFFTINYVTQGMNVPGTLRNRYRGPDFDYGWGISVVEGNTPGRTILSGIQTSRSWLFNPPYPTSMANINPFLAELRLDYSGGAINVITQSWRTILSNYGTGDPTFYPNNYLDLGGYYSNLAWVPRNAVRDLSWTTDIFLSSPIWNPNNQNKLNMKTIRTDRFGRLMDCPYYDQHLPGGVVYDAPKSIEGNPTVPDFAIANQYGEPDVDFNIDALFDCRGTKVFSQTGVHSPDKYAAKISLMPNPAHDYIQFQLEGTYNADALFEVELTDITGRHIADLFQGKASGLSGPISLPALTPGMYVVTVSSNGRLFHSQKLSVQ